jgi:hypothetical protein
VPQIKEYLQKTASPGPVDNRRVTGEDLGAVVSKSLANLGGEIRNFGDALDKKQTQDEVTDASVKLSQLHADFTLSLNDQIQKGEVNVEDSLQKFDDKAAEITGSYQTGGGQDFANKSIANLRSNFQVGFVSAKVQASGQKAVESYTESQRNFTSSLMNDPSSYAATKEMHAGFIDALVANGSLPEKAAEKLRQQGGEELAKSAVRGWMELDPADAKEQLRKGTWDTEIKGDTKKQLLGEADQHINAKRIEESRVESEADKAKKQQNIAVQNTFLAKMSKGQLSTKEILASPLEPFGSGSKEQFLKMIEQDSKDGGKIKTDPGVYADTFRRIHLPDGDKNKIADENYLNTLLGKGLTLDNIKQLRSEVQGKGTEAGEYESTMKSQLFDYAKAKLTKSNPLMGIKDPDGEQNLSRFYQYFQDAYSAGKQKGKSARELLDPDSPDYVGKIVPQFMKSPAEIMKAQMESLRGTKPQTVPVNPERQRKPGESPGDYLKRMGGTK